MYFYLVILMYCLIFILCNVFQAKNRAAKNLEYIDRYNGHTGYIECEYMYLNNIVLLFLPVHILCSL